MGCLLFLHRTHGRRVCIEVYPNSLVESRKTKFFKNLIEWHKSCFGLVVFKARVDPIASKLCCLRATVADPAVWWRGGRETWILCGRLWWPSFFMTTFYRAESANVQCISRIYLLCDTCRPPIGWNTRQVSTCTHKIFSILNWWISILQHFKLNPSFQEK